MKNRLFSFATSSILAALILTSFSSARADETNNNGQAKHEKKVVFFKGVGPLQFILAVDNHVRTRLGQILSIPSSLARAEVPKMRITTENPEDVLTVYNHLDDPLLGKWTYAGPVTNPA